MAFREDSSPMHHRVSILLIAVLALAGNAVAAGEAAPAAWSDAGQMVLVTVPGWNAAQGTLRTYERGDGGQWHEVGAAAPVVIGHAGAAWGLGLAPTPAAGTRKHEGDGRSPAGVFRIGTTFGYAARADTVMPYLALTATDYCMDVSGSPLYNRIADAAKVGAAALKGSSEPMRRDLHVNGDERYRLGFVIEHNPHAVPEGGSCIFGHLWKAPDVATTGCTAMAPATMRRLLAWLKPQAHPVFVLLPQAAYARLQRSWQLPAMQVRQ
jgi:L,D-peptidoglycan transpeptidase YkuD (ErfK/YbiS/YcfS/YnhG family)